MKLLIERTTDWLQLAKKFIGWRKLVEFLVHAETSLVIFSISVAASAILMAISITRASSPVAKVGQISLGSDPNFFANVSQAVLSVLSIYLIILPIARSRSLGLRYRFWFWGCLFISALSSILSLGLYSLYPVASGVLGWTGTFAQVAITLLLTRSIEEASKAGSIDSIELHVH
ncbi:hypothetical protein N431DRAFT_343785 [Stipitochalara longipes BDJ]|nr:hypothetical protein N431DRAFT_343785 [Stipitochalara longipes BDJ]